MPALQKTPSMVLFFFGRPGGKFGSSFLSKKIQIFCIVNGYFILFTSIDCKLDIKTF